MTAPNNARERKIIHIDMDAFYASIEQLDHPELAGKPVAVGGSRERGVVAAASYEARKFGVYSAMPSVTAARLCKGLIFVQPRFARYKEVSSMIHDIFKGFTDKIEPLALDEAYLDVTQSFKELSSAPLIAKDIKRDIKKATGLTASAGISYCKFLAKIASDMDKPDGLFVIHPQDAIDFLTHLPIKKFHGIGKVTAEKMRLAGIFTGCDLRKRSLEDLIQRYGKSGQFYYDIVRGIDNREVNSDRERKSISAERTFDRELMKMKEIREKLSPIVDEVIHRCIKNELFGKTVTIKIKYGDFRQITRSHTLDHHITNIETLKSVTYDLVQDQLLDPAGIRLLGVGVSNFGQDSGEDPQLIIAY